MILRAKVQKIFEMPQPPFYFFAFLPFYFFTLSPFHPFTFSPFHLFTFT